MEHTPWGTAKIKGKNQWWLDSHEVRRSFSIRRKERNRQNRRLT